MVKAHVRELIGSLGEMFWILPALLVLAGVFGAFGLIAIDRSGFISPTVLADSWLYNGGATGARTLLGAVASSTIGVAGTIFSITIAALSLAAGQMGPRLLRNFVRDRGNQVTLGTFLGTFGYALMVLRSVRTKAEGEFVPHLSLTVAIALALVCVATLIFFVGHMAQRINVDVVIELVSKDVRSAIRRLTSVSRGPPADPGICWEQASIVCDSRRGYLQDLDADALAGWAAEHQTVIKLLVRIGDYVFPGAPIALVTPSAPGVELAIRQATVLKAQRASPVDIEYTIRQLVEVAVRALSPGINVPHTAISVIDRLGAALCDVVPLYLPAEVVLHSGKPCLEIPNVDTTA
jgi:uncharacterized membrane protein